MKTQPARRGTHSTIRVNRLPNFPDKTPVAIEPPSWPKKTGEVLTEKDDIRY